MALYPLLLLALAACARSWPQLEAPADLLAPAGNVPRQLPYTLASRDVTPRQLPVDEDLDMSLVTLPLIHRPKRPQRREAKAARIQLPVDKDLDMSVVTLPVVQKRRRTRSARSSRGLPVDDGDLGNLVTLPIGTSRGVVSQRLPRENVEAPGVLSLPVVRSTKPGLYKRAVEIELANRSDVAYYAQLNFGTPPQPIFVQLDTGSFELWVNPDCTILPDRDIPFCEAVGRYDAALSVTSAPVEGSKTLRYGIGAANITYVQDSISIPGTTTVLQGVQFGVATQTEDQFAGILGIGYGEGRTTPYKNFIDELASQGVTSVRAFSLGLGSKNDQDGVITFGGADVAKFTGLLTRLPIIPAGQAPDGVPRYWVQMEAIILSPPPPSLASSDSQGRSRDSPMRKTYAGSNTPVFLDSGATLTLLPPDLALEIARDFGSEGEDEHGFYPVDCGFVDVPGTLDFQFDGVTVRVPYREMIRELRNPPRCYLGITPSEDFILLGDTFLRSAYVVFEPETHNIHMAQYTNCGSAPTTLGSVDEISRLWGICGGPRDPSSVSAEADTTSTSGARPSGGDTAEGPDSGAMGARSGFGFGLGVLVAVFWIL